MSSHLHISLAHWSRGHGRPLPYADLAASQQTTPTSPGLASTLNLVHIGPPFKPNTSKSLEMSDKFPHCQINPGLMTVKRTQSVLLLKFLVLSAHSSTAVWHFSSFCSTPHWRSSRRNNGTGMSADFAIWHRCIELSGDLTSLTS